MQIGSENRKKVMWASVLGGIAVLLIAYQLFSSPSGPVTAAQPEQCAAVRDFLNAQGAGVGVPRLRDQFPSLARAELTDLDVSHRLGTCDALG